MNLYRIDFEHYSQKDSEGGFKEYVLAETNEQVYHYVDKEYCYDMMEDKSNDKYTDWVEDYPEYKTYKEKMMVVKGRLNDDDFDEYDDLYYGLTLYGWKLIKSNVNLSTFALAIELNVMKLI